MTTYALTEFVNGQERVVETFDSLDAAASKWGDHGLRRLVDGRLRPVTSDEWRLANMLAKAQRERGRA